jgi:ribonuclease HII
MFQLPGFEGSVNLCSKGFNKLGSEAFLSLVRTNMDQIVVGIDEVGRGPCFGPMLVAACANVTGWHLPRVRDSKLVKKESERKALANEIRHNCIFEIAEIPAAAINQFGTLKSLKAAGNLVARKMVERLQAAFPGTLIHVIFDGRDFQTLESRRVPD